MVPGYTEGSELTFAGKTLPILDSDEVFTPTGKGEVLAKFGEDAGILSVPYGKGKVVVLGFNPGLKRYAALPAICEGLLRQLV